MKKNIKNQIYSLLVLVVMVIMTLVIVIPLNLAAGAGPDDNPVYVVELQGAVTTGQKSFIERQVQNALDRDAQLLVLVMNTPGGLVSATEKINELFLNAPVPIAVLVSPSGAIAGSAGAFLLLASDIAAMSPGTTVGAAQPIAISPEGAEATDDKTVTFYANYLRTIAEEKGRPGDIAEKFVTENKTLSANEALEKEVIEYMVRDVFELLEVLDGTSIEKQGETYHLNTAGANIVRDDMTISERLQNWVSDPQIAFLLLMIGFLGIYFGLSSPGTIVPEVSGLVLLVLGIYGIGLFDTNTAGIVMILLGAVLIGAEIFTSGFGILGIGGAASLLAGAILLPTEPLMARDWYSTFLVTVVGTVIGLLIIVLVVAQRIIQSRRKYKSGSEYFKTPTRGRATEDLDPEGMIRSRGELWQARSEDGTRIEKGTEVEVVRSETLKLWVRPLENSPGEKIEPGRQHAEK